MLADIKLQLELKFLMDSLKPHMEALDTFMKSEVSQFEPELQSYVKYCLENSGKRLRPILVLASGGGFGSKINMNLVKLAAFIEFIHIATLIHDDILDGAMVRRHNPTINQKHGTKMSVLLGDAIFAHALYLATDFPTIDVCRAVSKSTRRVCTGEITQTLWEGNKEYTEADYMRVIDLKTAELFSVSAYLGAKVGGASDEYAQAVEQFARQLGIAFQIFDDLKDYMETEETAGKTLGTDLATGKYTLPLFELMKALPESEREVFQEGLAQKKVSFEKCFSMMKEHSIFQKVRERCDEEVKKGEAFLQPFSDQKTTSALFKLLGYMRMQVAKYFK